ncbi:hypothetical protein [Streptomyces sp. SID5643]|uniref:hypothetical protein n=1 Tax=Streptomyces sp. SID5643 TaxID=2690307 RepID=UPI00136CBBBA|nr:hypothetical protein [Streptomyces sp. SID5643]MZF87582.1 hypothetical protein [Streptomyces sp. SID5643]
MRRPRPTGTCPTGKLRNRDRIAALLALGRIDNTDPRRGEARVCRSPRCRGWHLTGKPPQGNRWPSADAVSSVTSGPGPKAPKATTAHQRGGDPPDGAFSSSRGAPVAGV